MNRTYLLACHKPDSQDYCRGCVVETYSGDFETHIEMTKEAVIDRCAELEARPLGMGESGWTFVLSTAQDGQLIYSTDLVDGGESDDPEIATIQRAIAERVKAVREEAKRVIEVEANRQRATNARAKETADKRLLADLKAKYPDA